MSAEFIQQLLDASDNPERVAKADLRSLLRRAALCLDSRQNPGGSTLLIQEVAEIVDDFAKENDMSRDEAVNAILLDWGVSKGVIEIEDLDEDGK